MPDTSAPPDPTLAFGVVAGLEPELLTALAREVAELGYGGFWINDSGTPQADGLAGLAIVAAAAPSLDLGVGVLPLDRRTPAEIARRVEELGLPLHRLRLGVGSGGATRPLGLVRDGVADLRRLLPGARLYVSALGPRMSQLAGEVADGVLFNWATPDRLEELSRLVATGDRSAGRAPIERWSYVRATVGPDARRRLGEEGRRYAQSPAYGRAFEAMGAEFEDVGVAGEDLRSQLRPYREILDGVVVRALPREWTAEEARSIARAAAPISRD
jgi:alkanesulfonate monooxygenase SsuD/methylene tetrahydromethanopterin reductase-like flavin-dependent oxidoreductase (luciferase family)